MLRRTRSPTRLAALLATLAIVLMTFGGAVVETAAQPTDTPAGSGTEGEANTSAVAKIDANVVLLDYRYDQQAGIVVVELAAERPTLVTVADALGAYADRGVSEIRYTRKRIPAGPSTVRIEVTPFDGRVGVSIATPNSAVAISIEAAGSGLFTGPATWRDVQVGFGTGLTGGFLAVGYLAYSRVNSDDAEIEREL